MLDLIHRRGGQSAVQVNSLMHDCHVTMQVLNRLTQRHLLREPQHLQHLSQSALAGIMQTDLQIMREGRYDGRVQNTCWFWDTFLNCHCHCPFLFCIFP